jgi:signal transduction histidine kinase
MKLRLLIFINLIFIGLGPLLATWQFRPNAASLRWDFYFYLIIGNASGLLLNPFGLFLALYCERLEAKLRKQMSLVFFTINLLLALFWGLMELIRFPPVANTTYPHHASYLTWFFVAAWLLLASGYFACYQSEARSLANLSEAEQQQSEWSRQISEAAAQQERNRLARDLHDSIKQQIFSINVSAATAQTRYENDPEGAKTALADVRTSTRDALVEMEAMLQNLRPFPLETIGLIEALRKQGEALQYRTGANVISEFGELPEAERLPLGAQENLFRIAQEALSNIARHARAQNVTLRLDTDADEESFSLTIIDDGQGFDTHINPSGMGMKNMHSRAREMNGTLLVKSLPQQGTRLHLSLPLRNAERNHIKLLFRLAAFGGIAGTLLLGSWRETPPSTYTAQLLIWLTLWLGGATACVMGHSALRALTNKTKEPTNVVLELERYFRQLILLFFISGHWTQYAFIRPPNGSEPRISLVTPIVIVASCLVLFILKLRKELRALSPLQAVHRVRTFERHIVGVSVVSTAVLMVLAKLSLRPSLLAMTLEITAYVLTLLWFRQRVLKGKPL